MKKIISATAAALASSAALAISSAINLDTAQPISALTRIEAWQGQGLVIRPIVKQNGQIYTNACTVQMQYGSNLLATSYGVATGSLVNGTSLLTFPPIPITGRCVYVASVIDGGVTNVLGTGVLDIQATTAAGSWPGLPGVMLPEIDPVFVAWTNAGFPGVASAALLVPKTTTITINGNTGTLNSNLTFTVAGGGGGGGGGNGNAYQLIDPTTNSWAFVSNGTQYIASTSQGLIIMSGYSDRYGGLTGFLFYQTSPTHYCGFYPLNNWYLDYSVNSAWVLTDDAGDDSVESYPTPAGEYTHDYPIEFFDVVIAPTVITNITRALTTAGGVLDLHASLTLGELDFYMPNEGDTPLCKITCNSSYAFYFLAPAYSGGWLLLPSDTWQVILSTTGDGSQLTGITSAQVGALAPTDNGSQLTGITAAQVGAISTGDVRYLAALTNAPTLQQVTSAGATTTNLVTVGGVRNNKDETIIGSTDANGRMIKGLVIGEPWLVNGGLISEQAIINSDANPAGYMAHAFEDKNLINLTGSYVNAYASVSATPVITGSSNYDHFKGLQAWPYYNSSGSMSFFYATDSKLNTDGGVVTNAAAYHAYETAGTGTILTAYGLLIDNVSRGAAANYGLYVGGGSNYLAGNLGIGTNTPAYPLAIVGNANLYGDSIIYGTTAQARSPMVQVQAYALAANRVGINNWGITVQDNGLVGIATLSPAYALDVTGDARVSGYYRGNGSALTGITASQVGAASTTLVNSIVSTQMTVYAVQQTNSAILALWSTNMPPSSMCWPYTNLTSAATVTVNNAGNPYQSIAMTTNTTITVGTGFTTNNFTHFLLTITGNYSITWDTNYFSTVGITTPNTTVSLTGVNDVLAWGTFGGTNRLSLVNQVRQ